MKVIIAKDYEDGARKAADIIEKIVRDNPSCTLGLATGSSPVGMYRELARRCKEEGLDFSKVHSVNLDEYVGLDGTHDQSYRYFMNNNLFDHINIDKANTYVAKGTGDVAANLKEFNEILDRTDVDIQVLGVGPDGHLGFNQPGTPFESRAWVTEMNPELEERIRRETQTPRDKWLGGVTLGLRDIMHARRIVLVAKGANKRQAVWRMLRGPVTPDVPASILQLHQDVTIILDKEAAALLPKEIYGVRIDNYS